MLQTPQEKLRTLFPHLDEKEIAAVHERLKRYVALAVEVVRQETRSSEDVLTESPTGGTVIAGQVDPARTLTNTG